MAAQLSNSYGSGQPTVDLLFMALTLTLFAFWLGIRSSQKNVVKHTVIDIEVINAMITRVSELEIAIGELKSYIKQNTEHLKGETGYIKYAQTELLDALIALRKNLPPPVSATQEVFITEDKRLQRLSGTVQKVVGE